VQRDEEELQILRECCERLEERASTLFFDMEGLIQIAEVSGLSRRNDELMTSKDSNLLIRDRGARLKEYSTNASMSGPRQSSEAIDGRN